MGVEHFQLSTRDIFETPSQENLIQGVSLIESVSKNGKTVYVHCKAGRTRSATLVGCYLMWVSTNFIICYIIYTYLSLTFKIYFFKFQKHNWTPEEAIKNIVTKRPHIWLRSQQLESLQKYYDGK